MNISRYFNLSDGRPSFKCVDPLTLAAIPAGVSAFGNIVGGLFGAGSQASANEVQIRLARENRDWQSKENQLARDYQTLMWNKTNEYNSPANQRRLLNEAGYNPYLLGDYSGGQSSSPSSPAMAAAPSMPDIRPVNPAQGLSQLGSSASVGSSLLSVLQQGQQIDSNVELQRFQALQTLGETMLKLYKDGGQRQLDQFMKDFAPALNSLNFEGSNYQMLFNEELKRIRSERYNMDMDSLNKEFLYETSKKWTDKEKQAAFSNLQADTQQKFANISLMVSQERVNHKELEKMASEIARNFAEAFQAKKVGDYYEVSAGQLGIITKMTELEYQNSAADFAFTTDVRKYKKDITHRGVALGLFQGSLGSQNVRQSVESNKFLQYGKEVSSMIGNMFKVNFGVSTNKTNFRNLNPDNSSKLFYSGDGFYMNNGTLLKGNW